MNCVINDLTKVSDFVFIDKENNKVGLLDNGERSYFFVSTVEGEKALRQLLEELNDNISSVYSLDENYIHILVLLIERFEYKGMLPNLCREILKYLVTCNSSYTLYGNDEDVLILIGYLYPKIEKLGKFNNIINEMFDMVCTLDKFTMSNYDSHIFNNDINDNGDINIAYTTYDYKSVEDVEINVIFNIIDKTVKTVFTLYKDFDNNSYYANFCVYECKFATIKDIGRYFKGLEFDDLTCYSCEFEELVEQQAPNWQLITTT